MTGSPPVLTFVLLPVAEGLVVAALDTFELPGAALVVALDVAAAVVEDTGLVVPVAPGIALDVITTFWILTSKLKFSIDVVVCSRDADWPGIV